MNLLVLLYAAALAGLSLPARAQAGPEQPPPPAAQAAQAPRLSGQELSNLVAPIALYPDMLLSEVLAASTYPLELAQAQQWMQQNPGLRGQALVDAAKQQNWDPSVQALVAFPDVMNLLTRNIQWTTDLGNAFLAQQADVMDSVQRLRAAARDNGRLSNTPQQRVTYEQDNGQNAIVIQPTDPQVVYPPVYNPEYVWGPPAYGVYPPLGYPAFGYGIYYAVGTFLGALFTGLASFGGWGWGLSWLSHGLFLNGLFFSHFGFHGYSGYGFHPGGSYVTRAPWVHDPGHRLGVTYGSRYAVARYSGRSYNTGRPAYAGSGYHSAYAGGSRQMEAYRGLTAVGAQSARASSRGFSAPHFSASNHSAAPGHRSAPKSSGHFGGGGGHSHSSGGGHSHSQGGGGHSHGGGRKK
ncbi:MAG: DUF3300 domain-containing protein [Bryobacteraceae bacterium]